MLRGIDGPVKVITNKKTKESIVVIKHPGGDYTVKFKGEELDHIDIEVASWNVFKFCHPELFDSISNPEYEFLFKEPHLKDKLILVGLGGSYAYGTNGEGSDVDIRGVALNSKADLLGMSHFDTYVDPNTDTTIYGVNKFFRLLMDCNPNIIELLGLNPEDYLYVTPVGKKIIDNRDLFLSQRAYYSFGGYAYAQLKRIQNATARDSLGDEDRERHILHSIEKQIENIDKDFSREGGDIRLYIDDAVTDGHTKEIFMDGTFSHYPLRGFNMRFNSMNQVCKDYDHVDHRNRKKDEKHLCKHAGHLVRLLQMATEILNGEGIRTKRYDDNLELILDIRHGKYIDNGVMTPEFFQIVDEHQKKLDEAFANTTLPKKPDVKKIEELLIEINEEALKKEE